jgi:alkyl hydroperoxide reductase subunit AhpF
MAVLRPEDRKAVQDMFAGAEGRVEVLVLARGEVPKAFHDVMAELAELVPLLTVTERPYDEAADGHLTERAPAVLLLDGEGRPTGVRFAGYPAGYEFGTLVQDLADVAHARTALSADMRAFLADLREPLSIKVFTTPT